MSFLAFSIMRHTFSSNKDGVPQGNSGLFVTHYKFMWLHVTEGEWKGRSLGHF